MIEVKKVLPFVAALTALSGCSKPTGGRTSSIGVDVTTDLGSGIYQLPARDWPNNLAQFAKDHPELQIVDTESATSTGDGDPTSFVVVTAPKK